MSDVNTIFFAALDEYILAERQMTYTRLDIEDYPAFVVAECEARLTAAKDALNVALETLVDARVQAILERTIRQQLT